MRIVQSHMITAQQKLPISPAGRCRRGRVLSPSTGSVAYVKEVMPASEAAGDAFGSSLKVKCSRVTYFISTKI